MMNYLIAKVKLIMPAYLEEFFCQIMVKISVSVSNDVFNEFSILSFI